MHMALVVEPVRMPHDAQVHVCNGIRGLKGQLVFTDWISFLQTPKQGLLLHASVNRDNLQEAQAVRRFDVAFSELNLKSGERSSTRRSTPTKTATGCSLAVSETSSSSSTSVTMHSEATGLRAGCTKWLRGRSVWLMFGGGGRV
jgi:hypothetical protein